MGNFCHCMQLLGCDEVCSSYHSRRHCLLYPAILHHTPHHLLHASCHRRILLALRNSALIWPAVLCELIANCRAKTSKQTICSSLTFIIEKSVKCSEHQFLWGHFIPFLTLADLFSYKCLEQIWQTRDKNICKVTDLFSISLNALFRSYKCC